MAFVGGGGGGGVPSSSTPGGGSSGATPGPAGGGGGGQNGDFSAALLALAAGGMNAQQIQDALLHHQQQAQQAQMVQMLQSLLQAGQQQAAPPPPPVQQPQPQNNLLQQLQQHLLVQQLTAAASSQPAAGAAASSLTTLLLLLQQQQQLSNVLGGGGNPLMTLLQQNQQQSQQQEQNLLQQRLLMEILNSQQGGNAANNERNSLSALQSTAGTSTGMGGLTSLTRPQPVDVSSSSHPHSSSQSSSRSLLQQLQQHGAPAPPVSSSNPVQPLTHPPPMIRGNSGLDQARAAQAAAAAVRAAAVPQANINDPSSVETRIQRLIKQNEEILEPAPVLLKRRPYHRALGPQASIDNDSNHSGSSRTSPGLTRFPVPTSRPLPPPTTTRSQSLFELGLKPSSSSSTPLPSSSILPNGSLTSGQPMNRGGGGLTDTLQQMFMSGVEPSCSRTNESAPECPHCKLRFPNESTREAHQDRCSKKESHGGSSGDSMCDNRHPLKRRLLAAVAQQEDAAAKMARMASDPKPSTSFSSPSGNGEEIIIVGERAAPAAPPAAAMDTLRSFRIPQQGDSHSLNRRATVAAFPDSAAAPVDQTEGNNQMTREQQIDLIRKLMARGVPIDEGILALVGVGTSPVAGPSSQTVATTQPVQQPPLVKSSSEDSDDIQMREQSLANSLSESTHSAQIGRESQRERTNSSVWTKMERGDPEKAFQIYGELRGGTDAPYYMTYPLCSPHLSCVSESGHLSRHPHPDIKLDPVPYAAAAPVGFSRDSAIATTMCVKPLCAPKIMDPEESVYDNMYKVPDESNVSESKLNHLFMGAVSINPRMGERPFRYEMSKNDLIMKSTHSSFWFVSLKQRQLITDRAASNAITKNEISLSDAANECNEAREASVIPKIEMKEEVKEESMDTTPPPSDSVSTAVDMRVNLGGREAKDLSIEEDLTAIVEERRRAMEKAKEEEDHEAAIHAAKEQTMTSLGLKTDPRRIRDATSVDRMSIGDITALLDMGLEEVPIMAQMQDAQRDPVIGGYKTDEVYVYVRGRGRGRYVCERCGIRCKKPSMLKKHIKSHTDVRPYQCTECKFSFKTKGNLTKHLASKAHRRKLSPTEEIGTDFLLSPRHRRRSDIDVVGSDSDGDDDDRMEMGAIDDDVTKEMDILMEDNGGSDDDFDELDYGEEDETVGRGHLPSADRYPYHKFGQEQILIERRAHTPPTRWMRGEPDDETAFWPDTVYSSRRCTSAPPVVQQTMKEEDDEEKGIEDRARRRKDRRRRRRREGGDTRGNGSAASSKEGEEKKEIGGGEKGGGTTVPGTVGLYAGAQKYSPSDVQLSMTNATLSAQQAGRNQQPQMAMNSSYSSCLLDVPRLASALPPSASSLLTQSSTDQLQSSPSLHPSTGAAAAAGLIPAQGGSSAGPSSSTPIGSYQLETEEMKCGECDRVFRKASDYTMHVHTHNLERGKMRLLYTCPECKLGHKSKHQLLRHIELAHPLLAARGGGDEMTARQRSSSSCSSAMGGGGGSTVVAGTGQELPIEQTILNVTTNMTNNPRSFVCVDCNIGFRKHGILAKHLRSKTHVMKLETQKLLPEDSLTLITKRDNGTCLNEVDTTSCETARRSILRIVDRIREENLATAASIQVQALPSQTNGPHSSDDHRRLVVPIASHRIPSSSTPVDSISSSLFPPQRAPPTTEQLLELLSAAHRSLAAAAISSSSDLSSPSTSTTIASAAVWMPPRAEDVRETSTVAALTPVTYAGPTINRRPSFDANGYIDRLGNGHSSTAVTPPALTRCGVCEMNFENPMDHQIHVMTDHIVMRDGHDFACPRPNCEKVYPNRESLRVHILAHFRQYDREDESAHSSLRPFPPTTSNDRNEGKEEGEASASDEDTMEMEGGGEESSCPSRASTVEGGLRIAEDDEDELMGGDESEVEVRPDREESRGGLACTMCSAPPFETAAALQNHWITLHVALRPHVCTTCDASFTQREQLEFHIATTHRQ